MNNHIISIENYLEEVNKDRPPYVPDIPYIEPQKTKLDDNFEKTTLDMKILRNRMDSVSIIQYYKDLKNNRIKTNEKITYIDTEKDIHDIINKSFHDKPWNKTDNYTKLKKIDLFVNKLVETKKIESYDIVIEDIKKMLLEKKITKKNISFDNDNNIIKICDYIL